MRELNAETLRRAAAVLADVPEEAIEMGDLRESCLGRSDLVPFADVFDGRFSWPDGIVVLSSVGSAVLDTATAEFLVERAECDGIGMTVDIE